MAGVRVKAFSYILGGLLFAVGTPLISAYTQPSVRFYLLQPLIYAFQPIPYVLAAALWLPWRSDRSRKVALVLARVLCIGAAVFYVPILVDLVPTGGDMIGLGYILFAIVTTALVLLATVIGFGISWFLRRRGAPERRA